MNVHIYEYENKYTGWLNDFGPLNTNDALDLHYAVENCTYSGPYCVLKEGNSLWVKQNGIKIPLILNGDREKEEFLSIVDKYAQHPENKIPCTTMYIYCIRNNDAL